LLPSRHHPHPLPVEAGPPPEGEAVVAEEEPLPEVDMARVAEVDMTKVAEVDMTKVPEVDMIRVAEVDMTKVPEVDMTKVAEVVTRGTEMVDPNRDLNHPRSTGPCGSTRRDS